MKIYSVSYPDIRRMYTAGWKYVVCSKQYHKDGICAVNKSNAAAVYPACNFNLTDHFRTADQLILTESVHALNA